MKRSIFSIGFLLFASLPTYGHVGLIAPQGQMSFETGSTMKIEWRVDIQHLTLNWDIYYSVKGFEGPWIDLAIDLPAKNAVSGTVYSYDWTIPPEAVSDRLRVRVVQDNKDFDYEALSRELIVHEPLPPQPFRRGDANADGEVNQADAIFILRHLFAGDDAPACAESADVNDDTVFDASDPIYLLLYLYAGGLDPMAPFPDCAQNPEMSDEQLPCRLPTAGCG